MEKEKKTKKAIECVKLIGVLYVIFGVLFWQLFRQLYAFSAVQHEVPIWILITLTTIFSVGMGFIICRRKSFAQSIKFSAWLSNHTHRIILWYVVPIVILSSIKKEILMTISELKEIVTISWTIFGVIIAIYSIWHVLIPEFLKKQEPKYDVQSKANRYEMLYVRNLFCQKVGYFFVSVYLIVITLFVLLLATASVYMSTNGVTILNMNSTRCGFYCCVLTTILLFIDVIKLATEDRNVLLSKIMVSKEEIEIEAEKERCRCRAQEFIKVINNMDGVQDIEKQRMRDAVCSHYDIEFEEIQDCR